MNFGTSGIRTINHGFDTESTFLKKKVGCSDLPSNRQNPNDGYIFHLLVGITIDRAKYEHF